MAGQFIFKRILHTFFLVMYVQGKAPTTFSLEEFSHDFGKKHGIQYEISIEKWPEPGSEPS